MRYGIQKPIPAVVYGRLNSGRYGNVRKWAGRDGTPIRSVVIHRMDGNLSGSDGHLRRAISGATSAHFGVGYASWLDRALGRVSIWQWVDTANSAWAWAASPTDHPTPTGQRIFADLLYPVWFWPMFRSRIDLNRAVISVEVEGFHYQSWDPRVTKRVKELLGVIRQAHGPLWVTAHTDMSVKPCPGMANFRDALPGYYGNRLGAATLPNTAINEERALYEKWVPRVLPREGTVEIPPGTNVYRHPFLSKTHQIFQTDPDGPTATVEMIGIVGGDEYRGKSRWPIWARKSGGLAMAAEATVRIRND